MSMPHPQAQPIGGRIFTTPFKALTALFGIAAVLILYRLATGLGTITAMNDGYPWGLWIAFDVVTGTALACGGYAVALLVYVRNKGRYHPLVRPAVLTSALGYTLAGVGVGLDVGRWWSIWHVPVYVWHWNFNSVLLEVALCIMTYMFVLWIELSPAFLEKAEQAGAPAVKRFALRTKPIVEKYLLWLIALGILLPTMHQSSLGALMLIAGPRLHPLWNTGWLPLLFLLSCLGMGYAAVVFEAVLSSWLFKSRPEREMLADVGRALVPFALAYLVLRLGDLAVRGQLGALFAFDLYSVMSLLEFAIFAAAVVLLMSPARRAQLGTLFRAAMLFMLAGSLYRFDTYLVAFRPGPHWSYFPSVTEILVTLGLIAARSCSTSSSSRSSRFSHWRSDMSRITIDPVTRIEGHLRIDAEVDGGVVRKAWSSGQMFRGIERILQGRDPREAWLFTQRFCGVCTTVHAIASVRAVENALQLEVPLNAQYIRNLILAAHAMHDHIVHFYHLSALDWVDVVSALKADPAKASQLGESLSAWPGNSRMRMTAVRDRLKGFVDNGQLGIFQNGYWGHPAMKLPPEVNLLAVGALSRGARVPAEGEPGRRDSRRQDAEHPEPGGRGRGQRDQPGQPGDAQHGQALSGEGHARRGRRSSSTRCTSPTSAPSARCTPTGSGTVGASSTTSSVPDLPLDTKGTQFDFPGGVIMNGDLGSVQEIKTFGEPFFRENVTESIARAWYDGDWTKHPYDEDTEPKYTPFQDNGKYSWVKAPRFKGNPMQVGPLAQVLSGVALGHKPTVFWANKTLDTAGSIAKTKLTPAVLHSTLGRHAARMIRTQVIADLAQKHWNLLVNNIAQGRYRHLQPTGVPER